jgi:hypothetical protein
MKMIEIVPVRELPLKTLLESLGASVQILERGDRADPASRWRLICDVRYEHPAHAYPVGVYDNFCKSPEEGLKTLAFLLSDERMLYGPPRFFGLLPGKRRSTLGITVFSEGV